MPVFFIKNPRDPEGFFSLSREDLHHLRRVLRKNAGDLFEVITPEGAKGLAILQESQGVWRGQWKKSLLEAPTSRKTSLWLGIGLIRWSRMEWLVEKATELGVNRLSLLLTRFSQHQNADNISINKIKRLIKISQESLKQCERFQALQIDPPCPYQDWLQKTAAQFLGEKIFLRTRQADPLWPPSNAHPAEEVLALIGPEGGWSPEEEEETLSRGFKPVSLGQNILRTETAALNLASLWKDRSEVEIMEKGS